jgi:hypothetical protein
MPHPLEQDHNHNPGSVTLNYPCPVIWPRAVSHNRTKHRVVGPINRITPCLSYPCRIIAHPSHPGWGPDPHGGLGARHRCFLMLMVGAPRSTSAPSRGPPSMFSSVDGGRSRILRQHLPGGRHQRFLALMVGAPEFSDSTSQGPGSQTFWKYIHM